MLHDLALGGAIHFTRAPNGKIREVWCLTREGHILTDCTFPVFDRLRKRRLIRSRGGQPYRISRQGILTVRAQLNQR